MLPEQTFRAIPILPVFFSVKPAFEIASLEGAFSLAKEGRYGNFVRRKVRPGPGSGQGDRAVHPGDGGVLLLLLPRPRAARPDGRGAETPRDVDRAPRADRASGRDRQPPGPPQS